MSSGDLDSATGRNSAVLSALVSIYPFRYITRYCIHDLIRCLDYHICIGVNLSCIPNQAFISAMSCRARHNAHCVSSSDAIGYSIANIIHILRCINIHTAIGSSDAGKIIYVASKSIQGNVGARQSNAAVNNITIIVNNCYFFSSLQGIANLNINIIVCVIFIIMNQDATLHCFGCTFNGLHGYFQSSRATIA